MKLLYKKDTLAIIMTLTDDLVAVRWFDRAEVASVTHIPGRREFFVEMEYMD